MYTYIALYKFVQLLCQFKKKGGGGREADRKGEAERKKAGSENRAQFVVSAVRHNAPGLIVLASDRKPVDVHMEGF